ncbi:unnamed protein product [Thelazia callipaeda]|uniref:Ras-GEF domain-containing protein n=1 Tax=Thelazia callipaeda TaxID=103827 RepID=A0A0N5DA43_THECL|nr:unnamed protein product [Thelazia callipaeda]
MYAQNEAQELKDEVMTRRCIEAIRFLASLWVLYCFEKTEAGQCSTFYVELFGSNNPRQIINTHLCKSQLSHIGMVIFADMLKLRLELLDCTGGSIIDEEQPELLQNWIPEDLSAEMHLKPVLTFLKVDRTNFLYALHSTFK